MIPKGILGASGLTISQVHDGQSLKDIDFRISMYQVWNEEQKCIG